MGTAAEKRQDNGAAPNAIALVKKDVVDVVGARVEELVRNGQLELPEKYAVGSALMSWWLALQSCVDKDKRPALSVCTRDSIANATLDMVVQGLTPAKKQCYPVVYGTTLVCQRSYFGDEAVLRRARPDVAHVWTEVYYEGDTVEWEINRGRRVVGRHLQAEENIGGLDKIRGAYAVIEDSDGEVLHCERMTIDQIKTSWKKSKTYGKGDTFHKEQPEEACKRTAIRRACKRLINASDDSYLVRAVERSDFASAEAELAEEAEGNANATLVDFPDQAETGKTKALLEAQEAVEAKYEEPAAEVVVESEGPGF